MTSRSGPDDEALAKTVEQAILELNAEALSTPLQNSPYVARLFCGHDIGGETRATNLRIGSHGQWCELCHAFSLFQDVVLARDLVA